MANCACLCHTTEQVRHWNNHQGKDCQACHTDDCLHRDVSFATDDGGSITVCRRCNAIVAWRPSAAPLSLVDEAALREGLVHLSAHLRDQG